MSFTTAQLAIISEIFYGKSDQAERFGRDAAGELEREAFTNLTDIYLRIAREAEQQLEARVAPETPENREAPPQKEDGA